MATGRHLELCKILFWFSETDRETSFALVRYDWIMQTLYYTTMHLGALWASLLSETNVYLLFLAAILDLASRWPPNIILTAETDLSPSN